ncbi:MAG: hypothetical protein ACXADL_06250 [Candidatus Thorarchaeota archaeon]|jgi:hypothetical protein
MVDRRGTGPESSEPAHNVFRIENTHLTNDIEIERFRADALQGISPDTEILQIDDVYPMDIDYSPLATCRKLREVSIKGSGWRLKLSNKEKYGEKTIDLSPINMDNLQKLHLDIGIGMSEIELDLTNLDKATKLEELSLRYHSEDLIIPNLTPCNEIKKATLHLNNPSNIDFLVGNTSIEDIDITGMWNKSFDLGEINKCESLKKLRIRFFKPETPDISFSRLSEVDSLETLRYSGPDPSKNKSRWIPLKSLRRLHIISPISNIDLSSITDAEELKTVFLAGISSEEIDLTPLKDNNSIEELVIYGYRNFYPHQVKNIVLSGPRTLKQLAIHTIPEDKISPLTSRRASRSPLHFDLKGLSECKDLERLSLHSNPRVQHLDLSPLRNLKRLKTLNLSTYSARVEDTDLRPLEECDSLQTLVFNLPEPSIDDEEYADIHIIDVTSLFMIQGLENVSIRESKTDYKRDFVTNDGITTSSDMCLTKGAQPVLHAELARVPESLRTPSWSRHYKIKWY